MDTIIRANIHILVLIKTRQFIDLLIQVSRDLYLSMLHRRFVAFDFFIGVCWFMCCYLSFDPPLPTDS